MPKVRPERPHQGRREAKTGNKRHKQRKPTEKRPAKQRSISSAWGCLLKIRVFRGALLLVGQVLLLLFFQKGSLPLLFFTGIIWVMLGRARSTLALPTANSANTSNGGDAAKNIHLQRLREQLKRSVRERASQQKK